MISYCIVVGFGTEFRIEIRVEPEQVLEKFLEVGRSSKV